MEIKQISAVADMEGHTVYGLAADGQVYIWEPAKPGWRLWVDQDINADAIFLDLTPKRPDEDEQAVS